MSWSNNCHKLPRIADYAAAEKRFNDTAQPRASFWGAFQRPLDGARAHHKRIQFDPSNQAYELVLYRTPLVTYYPDGTITVSPYSSKMSRDFLYATLPLGLSVTSHADETMVVARTLEGQAWYSKAVGALYFKRCGNHLWQLTSPADREYRLCDGCDLLGQLVCGFLGVAVQALVAHAGPEQQRASPGHGGHGVERQHDTGFLGSDALA